MALKPIYERFLTSPNPLSLSENASLHYITTLTTFSQSGPIVRHLDSQNKAVVRKRSEKVINAVEGHGSIALEVEVTLEFLSGGGAYLPGLENFVTDRVATLPMMHVVQFNSENKIQQIRISWDQGSLLQQVEVIGSRGRNWPITDGNAQIKLISSSLIAAPAAPVAPNRGREMETAPLPTAAASRSMSPNKKHIRDPHASLDLFEPVKNDENRSPSVPIPIAPRASIRPPQREMSELFAAGHEDYEPSAQNGGSPKKEVKWEPVAPKGAGSQKFQPSRLFDTESEIQSPAGYKSDPAKYNHFDLGEAEENDPMQHKTTKNEYIEAIPMRAKTNKHLSQWDFKDFVTPEKYAQRIRGQDVRHFGWSDDEGENDETPGKHPAVLKPRKDAETHFDFNDDGTPVAPRATGPPQAGAYKMGMGLYESHLYGDEAPTEFDHPEKKPLGTITNNVGRKNDFGPHWSNTDTSPERGHTNNENKAIGQDQLKHVKLMDSQWDTYDESPEQDKKPAAAGHLRRGQETHWGFTGVDEEPVVAKGGKKQEKNFWDF